MFGDTPSSRVSRRTLLKYTAATVVGGAALGATGIAGGTESAPDIEWQQPYGGERLSLSSVRQTPDEGYLLAGSVVPLTDSGAGTRRLALLKVDADGERQWTTAIDDDRPETTALHCSSATLTDDGGVAVVGYADDPLEDGNLVGGLVGVAAKVDDSGTVEWVESLDAFEAEENPRAPPQGHEDDASFEAVAPAGEDGGFLAVGDYEYEAWAVRFGPDGEVVWERRLPELGVGGLVRRVDGGHDLFAVTENAGGRAKRVVSLDSAGGVLARTDLGIDYDETPHNHEFVAAATGGYAFTGRDRSAENFVLGRLDADGSVRWREEYDGPDEDGDFSRAVIQTGDGGFALAGYMSDRPSENVRPAVLKTDATGGEQWERTLSEFDAGEARDIVETADGGYAVLLSGNELVKFGPDDVPATEPGDDSETPDEGTDVPDNDSETIEDCEI